MDNFLSGLGLAKKADMVVFGLKETIAAIKSNKVFAVFCADDASQNTIKEAVFFCNQKDVPLQKTSYRMEELGRAIGERLVAVISVTDKGFAEMLKEKYSDSTKTGGAEI